MSTRSGSGDTDYIIYAACALVAAVLGYLVFFGLSTSDKAVDGFLSNIQTGQYLKAQEALSEEAYKNVLLFYGGISVAALKPHYRSRNMKTYKYGLIEKTKKSARYRINVMDPSGNMTADTIDLVRKYGVWKISNF